MSETAARARRDRRQQRMAPGNSADRSVGRDWITQCLSASKRPPPSKMERSPPAPNTGAAFPPHDGARLRAAHLSANSLDLVGWAWALGKSGVAERYEGGQQQDRPAPRLDRRPLPSSSPNSPTAARRIRRQMGRAQARTIMERNWV